MKDFLGWFQAGGVAAILAVVVSIYRMKMEKGEKIEAKEASVTVAFLQGLQTSVNQLTTENLELRKYVNERDAAHRAEIDMMSASHRREIEDLRTTHRADISSLRTDYERQLRLLKVDLDALKKEQLS